MRWPRSGTRRVLSRPSASSCCLPPQSQDHILWLRSFQPRDEHRQVPSIRPGLKPVGELLSFGSRYRAVSIAIGLMRLRPVFLRSDALELTLPRWLGCNLQQRGLGGDARVGGGLLRLRGDGGDLDRALAARNRFSISIALTGSFSVSIRPPPGTVRASLLQ